MGKHDRPRDENPQHSKVRKCTSSSKILYSIVCSCSSCGKVETVLLNSAALPESVLELLTTIRTGNTRNFAKEILETTEKTDIRKKLTIAYLMEQHGSVHECYKKTAKWKLAPIDWSLEEACGKFHTLDLLQAPANATSAIAVLHKITARKFRYIPKDSVVIELKFVVSPEWMKRESRKKKKKKKASQSISVSE